MAQSVQIVDPSEVRVARLSRKNFEDDKPRLRFVFVTEYDDEPLDVELYVKPEPALALLMGVLDGLGFPEQDIEYLANRYRQEFA